jgi:hypothetical protein
VKARETGGELNPNAGRLLSLAHDARPLVQRIQRGRGFSADVSSRSTGNSRASHS